VTRARAVALGVTAACALVACAGEERGGSAASGVAPPAGPPAGSRGGATAGTGSAAAGRPAGIGTPACPRDGRWRACSVVEALDQAGLVPRVDSANPAPRAPFLSVPATRIVLGRGAIHAFVYDDTARLARDVAALDTVRVAPRGGRFDWDVPPTFVRSANLVAVLLVTNEHQIERVRLALEAGPPQPDPARP